MKTYAEQIACNCVHFNGIRDDKAACDAGVVYLTVKQTDEYHVGLKQYPCWRGHEDVPCQHRRFHTDEEVAAIVAEHDEHTKKLFAGIKAAQENAKKLGFKKGNGGNSYVKCPSCADGTIAYTVSGYNGHLWGRCSTPDCCSWMQ